MLALLLSASGILRLGFDGDLRTIFLFDDEANSAYQRLHQSFPDVESDVSILISGEPFTPLALNSLHRLDKALSEITDIQQTFSILNLPGVQEILLDPVTLEPLNKIDQGLAAEIRIAVTSFPHTARLFIGDDGQFQRLIVQLNTAVLEDTNRLTEIKTEVEKIATRYLGEQSTFYLSGFAILKPALRQHIESDLKIFIIIGVSLAFALSVLLFRKIRVALIMAAGPATGVLWTLGLMGWVNQPISIFSSVLPPLLFVIGYANAAHIVFSIQQLAGSGFQGSAIGWHGMRRVHRACLVSAVTTGIGFISLYFVASEPVARFGLFAGIGNMLTYLAVVLVTPALCDAFPGPDGILVDGGGRQGLDKQFSSLSKLAIRHRNLVVSVGVIVSLMLVWLAIQAKPDYQFRENFSATSPFYQAVKISDQQFGGAFSLSIVSEWAEGKALTAPHYLAMQKQLEELAETVFHSKRAVSLGSLVPVDTAQLLPDIQNFSSIVEGQLLRRFLDPVNRRGLLIVPIPDRGSRVLLPQIAEFKVAAADLLQRYPGYRIDVTGLAFLALQGGDRVIDDIARSLGFAVCAIFIVISIALGSIRAGLICMLPNILPVAGVGAILVLLGLPLQYTSVLVFAICLGVAVDDSVHLTMRFNSLRYGQVDGDQKPESSVVTEALSQVGPAMVFTTLITIAGFCSLVFSDTGSVASVGYLSICALVLALVADLLFLPALLMLRR